MRLTSKQAKKENLLIPVVNLHQAAVNSLNLEKRRQTPKATNALKRASLLKEIHPAARNRQRQQA